MGWRETRRGGCDVMRGWSLVEGRKEGRKVLRTCWTRAKGSNSGGTGCGSAAWERGQRSSWCLDQRFFFVFFSVVLEGLIQKLTNSLGLPPEEESQRSPGTVYPCDPHQPRLWYVVGIMWSRWCVSASLFYFCFVKGSRPFFFKFALKETRWLQFVLFFCRSVWRRLVQLSLFVFVVFFSEQICFWDAMRFGKQNELKGFNHLTLIV